MTCQQNTSWSLLHRWLLFCATWYASPANGCWLYLHRRADVAQKYTSLTRHQLQDKVNISVAIIPMAEDFGWNSTVSGLVQSSFFFGYMLTQIPGGYIIAKKGGRKILPVGVGLWSLATAAVPVMAGTMPGVYSLHCLNAHIL